MSILAFFKLLFTFKIWLSEKWDTLFPIKEKYGYKDNTVSDISVFDNNKKFVNNATGSIGGLAFNNPLIFESQNAAIDYAKSQNLEYEIVINKKQKDFFFNSYTKNFI